MKKNQLLNIILEDTLAGFWDWNIPANEEYLSPTFKKMFGYEDHELENKPETWQNLIFKEDLPIVLKNFEEHVKTKGEIPFDNIVRYKHKNGSTVNVICKGNVIEWNDDGSPLRMVGSHIDITKVKNTEKELTSANKRFNLIVEGINAGIWDWDVLTGEEWWSDRFFELLGYKINELPPTFDTFLNVLLHPEDKDSVNKAVQQHFEDKIPYKLEIRLKTKLGNYKWFETAGTATFNKEGKPLRMAGSIVNINVRHKTQMQLEETGTMAKVGGWEIDLLKNEMHWTKEVYDIHGLPYDKILSVEESINSFHPDYVSLITEKVNNAIKNQEPYDVELKLLLPSKKSAWVRSIGKPIANPDGKVVALQGVIQNIDAQKKKEEDLNNTINIVSEQNGRLRNFAHIVSHNLRTHTGNLEMMLDMLKGAENEEEKDEMIGHLYNISANLSETILHLNEVVTIQTKGEDNKKLISFKDYFDKTLTLLEAEIKITDTIIKTDFSAVEQINYVPAYFESILLNLTTNAIKYKHPDRNPFITVKTMKENGKKVLLFTDNGSGIDLTKHKAKVFGMYKTFHKNKNSRGIGLFITKNQIEALGGSITVESEVGKGTTFKIVF